MGFMEVLKELFAGGAGIALLGGVLAAISGGWGSAIAVARVGKTSMGVLAEDPSLYGKALIMQALPATQGIYGLLVWFMVMLQAGFLNNNYADVPLHVGMLMFLGCLPSILVLMPSSIQQGQIASSGVQMILRRPEEQSKALVMTAMVETYSIFALLISVLVILFV